MLVQGGRPDAVNWHGIEIPLNSDGSIDVVLDGQTIRVDAFEESISHNSRGVSGRIEVGRSFIIIEGTGMQGNSDVSDFDAETLMLVGKEGHIEFDVGTYEKTFMADPNGGVNWEVTYLVDQKIVRHSEPDQDVAFASFSAPTGSEEPENESKTLSSYLDNK